MKCIATKKHISETTKNKENTCKRAPFFEIVLKKLLGWHSHIFDRAVKAIDFYGKKIKAWLVPNETVISEILLIRGNKVILNRGRRTIRSYYIPAE